MRQIIFKAKQEDNGESIEGSLIIVLILQDTKEINYDLTCILTCILFGLWLLIAISAVIAMLYPL